MNISKTDRKTKFVLSAFLLGAMAAPSFFQTALAASNPSQILDLSSWKLTLPTGSKKPTEVVGLANYSANPYFQINSTGDGVVFRAPVNGKTTSNSGYPRSELREMGNGGNETSWSTTSGTHTMFIDEAVTSVPKKKKHIVVGQVHGADDDVIVVRLEYPKLFVDINGKTGPTLDPNYTLGKRFTVKFVAENGQIKVYYNGGQKPAYVLNKKGSGNYFKAGAYAQSNCSKESDCSSNNYGEVVIYKLLLNKPDPSPASATIASSDQPNAGDAAVAASAGEKTDVVRLQGPSDQQSSTQATPYAQADPQEDSFIGKIFGTILSWFGIGSESKNA